MNEYDTSTSKLYQKEKWFGTFLSSQCKYLTFPGGIIPCPHQSIYQNLCRGSGGFKSCKGLLDRVENNDPQLQELVILPMKTFGAVEVERLADIICSGKNHTLKSISASGHSIPAPALKKLGGALAQQTYSTEDDTRTCSNLCAIAIGDEHMGDEGVEALCMPLEAVKGGTLEKIDLGFKNVSTKGAAAIGKVFGQSRNIKEIEMYRNPSIGDEGIIAFSSSAEAGDKAIEGNLPLFQSLEMLDISECNIGNEGIHALVDCLVKNEGIIERSSPLHLNASMNPLGSESCHSLGKLVSTNTVNKLSLRQCFLGSEGILSLVKAFKVGSRACQTSVLDLAKNEISTEGAIGLASVLKLNIKLVELSLANNPIGDNGVLAIANALTENRKISSSNDDDDAGTRRTLDLSGTECGVEGAVAIIKCQNIASVRLFNNNLGSKGFESIAPLLQGGHPTLEHLDLGGNRAEEHAVVTLIKALMLKHEPDTSKLKTIELGGNEVGDDVERMLKELEILRPDLDVARDKPSVEQPNEFQDQIHGRDSAETKTRD